MPSKLTDDGADIGAARAVLDSITFGVAVVERDGTVIATNRAWERFVELGAPRLDAARCGGNYLALLRRMAKDGNPFAAAGIAALDAVIRRERPIASLEHELRVQGKVRWFHARATPFAGSEGRVVITHLDITPRVVSHLALEQAHQRLRELAARLADAEERQRCAIARELHDDVCQSLASVAMGLHRLQGAEAGRECASLLAECTGVLEASIGRLHGLSGRLGTPELRGGLAAALEALVCQVRHTTGRHIEVHLPPAPLPRTRRAVALACYRIAQEALNNAVRHANASQISVRMRREGGLLKVDVRDNGVGLDPPRARGRAALAGLGLRGMTERARLAGGQLRIRSAPGLGTTVTAVFPLAARRAR